MQTKLRLLENLSVVELGSTVIAAGAGSFLGMLGASVTKVQPEDAPASEFASVFDTDEKLPLLGRYLDYGKTVISSNLLVQKAIDDADIVICDLDGTLPQALFGSTRTEYLSAVASLNRGAWVSVSAFGLHGPYSEYKASELCMLAAGGSLGRTRSSATDNPMKLAGHQGQFLVGEVAAMAALHATLQRRAHGQPLHFEVSAQEAILSTGPFLECARVLLRGGAGSNQVYGSPAGVFSCSDGTVLLYVMEERHWSGLVAAMGSPKWCEKFQSKQDRVKDDLFIKEQVAQWSSGYSKDECTRILQENGVPSSPIYSPLDLLSSEQFAARDFMVAENLGSPESARFPGCPVQVRSTSSHDARAETKRADRSFRVLDLTSVLGPPASMAWLGAMGAEVVKVEDLSRLDIYRRFAPFADDQEGINRGAYFLASNFCKESVALDLASEEGRAALHRLVEWADLVVENQSMSHMARLGINDELLKECETSLISSSGFGRSGPLRNYRGYGQNIGGYGGLLDLSVDDQGGVVNVGTPWADMVTAQLLIGLSCGLRLSGTRAILDVSMAEAVARRFGEYVTYASLHGKSPVADVGNDVFPLAPNGAYRCAGEDRWIALSVSSDEEWETLKTLLPTSTQLASEEFATTSSRYAHRKSLDAVLDQVFQEQSCEYWFERLQQGGIRAVPLWNAVDLVGDPHLAERGYFVSELHSEIGEIRLPGLAWRPALANPLPVRAAPVLGSISLDDVLGPLETSERKGVNANH